MNFFTDLLKCISDAQDCSNDKDRLFGKYPYGVNGLNHFTDLFPLKKVNNHRIQNVSIVTLNLLKYQKF